MEGDESGFESEDGRPGVFEDVETDGARGGGDVGVVDLGREADLGRLEVIVRGEGDREEEHAAGVRRVTLGGQYR